jgi:hypothetical protein
VLDIQLHSQLQFFGKYAQMYFDNKARRKQTESQTGQRHSKTQDMYRQLPEVFDINDVMKVGDYKTTKTATACIHLWTKRNLIKKIVNKKSNEKWQKM